MDLFTPSASWANAASHVRVFKLSNIIVFLRRIPGTPSDDEWRQVFADLERRGIDVAMEWRPLTPGGCGAGIEGFDGASAASSNTSPRRPLLQICVNECNEASTPAPDDMNFYSYRYTDQANAAFQGFLSGSRWLDRERCRRHCLDAARPRRRRSFPAVPGDRRL